MVTEFKIGKYYRWIGSKEIGCSQELVPILDGKWRKCIYAAEKYCANFEGINIYGFKGWNFKYFLTYFEEKKQNLIKTEEILKNWK
jgi:hypothetical protein